MIDWLMDEKTFGSVMEKYNIKDAWKMILFLSIIKIFSHGMGAYEKATNKKISMPTEFGLETSALLWTDLAIRFISKDWLPKNPEDLKKFLLNDWAFIVTYLLSLKWIEWGRVRIPWMVSKVKDSLSKEIIEVDMKANWEVKIIHKREEIVAEKKKRVSNMEQSRNIERNKWNKKEAKRIGKELLVAKSELKEAKSLPMDEPNIPAHKDIELPIITHDKAKKPPENDQTSNVTHTVEMRKAVLDLEAKTLEETLVWFDKAKLKESILSDNFRNYLEGEFWKQPEIAKIWEKVYTVTELEVNRSIGSLSGEKPLNKDELLMIERFKTRISKEFTEALTMRIQWKPLETKYWDPVRVEKMVGMFVENVNDGVVVEVWWDVEMINLLRIRQQKLKELLNKAKDGKKWS